MTTAGLHERVKQFLESKGTKCQDLYVIGGNYINLRHKAAASYHRCGMRHEFGIPKVCWERYVQLAREHRIVYSLIVEDKTKTLYAAKVIDLAAVARVYYGDDIDNGGTVFVPRDAYKTLNE